MLYFRLKCANVTWIWTLFNCCSYWSKISYVIFHICHHVSYFFSTFFGDVMQTTEKNAGNNMNTNPLYHFILWPRSKPSLKKVMMFWKIKEVKEVNLCHPSLGKQDKPRFHWLQLPMYKLSIFSCVTVDNRTMLKMPHLKYLYSVHQLSD